MRNVVIQDDFREKDIRPGNETADYLSLVAKDARAFFKVHLMPISCPACLTSKYSHAFKRFGFDYVECEECKTVFMNPRPAQDVVDDYYRRSEAAKFWARRFLKISELSRKDHIYSLRVNWVLGAVRDNDIAVKRYLDVFSKYSEMLESLKQRLSFDEGYSYCPMVVTEKMGGFQILNEFSQLNKLSVGLATMFEVIERVSEPDVLIGKVKKNLTEKALLFLTTSSIDGFEHQVLWDKSNHIFPPDHMNLFSIHGLINMLKRNGLKILELSTPGNLDVDIVSNRFAASNGILVPRFIEKILDSDDKVKLAFQRFLQENRLSSHVRIVCQAV